MRKWILHTALFVMVLGFSTTAFAQNAQIIGTLKDQSGGCCLARR